VKEQKQGGLIQSTELLKENPLPSRLVAQNVAKQTLSIFMLTAKAEEPTKFVVNATRNLATKDGTRDHGWIDGHQEITNMVLQKSFLLLCMKNNKENVQSVKKYQKPQEDFILTTATKLKRFVDYYVMAAMWVLDHLGKTRQFSSKPSVI
jgi:hypothetical protein